MTSTSVFYGSGSTLTVHMPRGSCEAVLMIEGLDNVASITLPIDQVLSLLSTLQTCAQQLQSGDTSETMERHEATL